VSEILIALDGRPLDEAVRRSFAALPSAGKRAPLTVLLSGALAQPFVFGPVQGLRGWREALAAATAAAPSVCDIDAECQVSVQGDPRSTAALATAVKTATLDAIYAIAADLDLKVRSVRPVWALAIERAGADAEQATMLACRDSDALTVLADDGQQWRHASVHQPAPSDLHALLRRTMTGLDMDAGRSMLVDVRSALATGDAGAAFECSTLDLESRP
jgi:hypothetical protein